MLNKKNILPPPDTIALAQSEKCRALIAKEIGQQGPISFARFMELALYAPGLGYYSAGTHKLGAKGDFVTAPEISALFSRCLAVQCRQILSGLENGDILEFGAGSGIMAADILLTLAEYQCLPTHYYILEVSADLKARQQQLLAAKIPQFYERIIWLDSLENVVINGVILANEVIDAMPVHKFKIINGIKEFFVDYQQNQFIWLLKEATNPELIKQVQALGDLAEGYESEINLLLPGWIASISKVLNKGCVLIIDYGFPSQEFYHPDRDRGTLMCHYQHHAHDDPFTFSGLQDITAHVDFTTLATSAQANQLEIAGYITQTHFLLNCGITELTQHHNNQNQDSQTQFRLNQQLKLLLMPSEMGELFKVMALTKHWYDLLLGFSHYDRRDFL